MVDLESLLTDLAQESAELESMVATLPPSDWTRPTPAPGWSIAHQIAHLAWTDRASRTAIADQEAFFELLQGALADPEGFVDSGAGHLLAETGGGGPDLVACWRTERETLAGLLRDLPPGTRVPWFGNQMSPASMATARIMETWAHGQDVADALGVPRMPTRRLRHIAHLGARTLGHAFAVRGRAVPEAPVRIELTSPDATETWSYGPADATDLVRGPALDFCLLVTRRRHRADLALTATGSVADEWLDIAQAFAGTPGPGRQPTGTSGSDARAAAGPAGPGTQAAGTGS